MHESSESDQDIDDQADLLLDDDFTDNDDEFEEHFEDDDLLQLGEDEDHSSEFFAAGD